MSELNYWVLIILAPLLVLIGVAGFLIPSEKSLTSGAPAYNVFHILFGIAGILVATHHHDQIRYFNIGFGLIDLYQAAASYMNWFPQKYFKWSRVDDLLHIIIGSGLVLVGVFAG
jgi:hypothetical protein